MCVLCKLRVGEHPLWNYGLCCEINSLTPCNVHYVKSPVKQPCLEIVWEAGTELIPMNTLKKSLHCRRNVHNEQQKSRPDNPISVMEPKQQTAQNTWSVATEDTFHATDRLDLVGGVSYERSDLRNAQDYNTASGLYDYPPGPSSAVNWQAASTSRQSNASEFHASLSSRPRLPTLIERFRRSPRRLAPHNRQSDSFYGP